MRENEDSRADVTSGFWSGKRVLVTGGAGFIGSHLVRALQAAGAEVTATSYAGEEATGRLDDIGGGIRILNVDLTRVDDCLAVCEGQQAVFSIAHADGTVEFKKARPAFILRQNMLITLNLLEAAGRQRAERFLIMSSAEVYPANAPAPAPEQSAFTDMSDRLTEGYVWSKRMSELAAHMFAAEYGLQIGVARANNVYGPGDYFEGNRGRVIPRFIRETLNRENLVIWGTGEARRTFLYVEDLVRGLMLVAERHANGDPVNLTGTEEISILDLALLIARLCGHEPKIVTEAHKPAGAARRLPDGRKASEVLGFVPGISLEEGLRRTIADYLRARAKTAVA